MAQFTLTASMLRQRTSDRLDARRPKCMGHWLEAIKSQLCYAADHGKNHAIIYMPALEESAPACVPAHLRGVASADAQAIRAAVEANDSGFKVEIFDDNGLTIRW